MTRRYRNLDFEDVPAPQDSVSLGISQPDHSMPGWDSESPDEYNEETDTHHPLADLLEQFWQLQDWFSSLKSTSGGADTTYI